MSISSEIAKSHLIFICYYRFILFQPLSLLDQVKLVIISAKITILKNKLVQALLRCLN
jgi:hypothetical protein